MMQMKLLNALRYIKAHITYNNTHNIVVLGGCETPVEAIKLIKMSLDEKNRRKSARSKKRSVMINIDENKEENMIDDNVGLDALLEEDFRF